MTTAIYFNETPTQRIARGNSERPKDYAGDRNDETANSRMKKRNLIQRLRNRELG